MDKFDRIFQLHAILSARRTPVPLETLLARLECSRATLYRAVTALKDQLNAPIVYDADAGGFLYQRLRTASPRHHATPAERRRRRPARGTPGRPHPPAGGPDEAPAPTPKAKPPAACASPPLPRDPRDLPSARWPQPPCSKSNSGSSIASAVLGWYLDAWDDDKDALRSFAIDRIRRATVLPDTALDIPEAQLDEHYASAYGIFGGKADKGGRAGVHRRARALGGG